LNGVIECAIMTWQLPERVKRLSLPSYRYHLHDLDHLHVLVAEDAEHAIIGVAAWEPASPRDLLAGQSGLLLHGLYVDPTHQRCGVGTRLLDSALTAAREQEFNGLLVKAQADANGFFEEHGMQRLPVEDPLPAPFLANHTPRRNNPLRLLSFPGTHPAVRLGISTREAVIAIGWRSP
jgi:GNAT superfamily N-acetyltransferase